MRSEVKNENPTISCDARLYFDQRCILGLRVESHSHSIIGSSPGPEFCDVRREVAAHKVSVGREQ
jgi:hypothetical protein